VGVGNLTSTITPIGFLFAIVMGGLLVSLPRRLSLLPIILTVCYMTIGQQVVVAGLHFSIMRILILSGWIRLFVRSELKRFQFNEVDGLIIAWQVSRVITNTLQYGTMEAFVGINGYAYDAIGMYFLLRYLIRDAEEIPQIIKMICMAVVPLAILMLIERFTTTNIFSVFGGVSIHTMIDEEERLRCQGPFRHPIMAGTFGATLLPLFVGLGFWSQGYRKFVFAGILSALTIVITARSSGPVVASALVVVGMFMWRLRHRMKLVRWSGLFGLIALHIVMKDPVWALYGRLSELIGGTGYHRTMLITAAVNHVSEWWLWGTHYTAHWMPYTLRLDPTMADMTNQFIYEGVVGGILTLGLFTFMISRGFGVVGKCVNSTEKTTPLDKIIIWTFGVSLFSHVVSFMSVSYFDQNVVMLYFVLACISLYGEELAIRMKLAEPLQH
jgi:hypothetical protein